VSFLTSAGQPRNLPRTRKIQPNRKQHPRHPQRQKQNPLRHRRLKPHHPDLGIQSPPLESAQRPDSHGHRRRNRHGHVPEREFVRCQWPWFIWQWDGFGIWNDDLHLCFIGSLVGFIDLQSKLGLNVIVRGFSILMEIRGQYFQEER